MLDVEQWIAEGSAIAGDAAIRPEPLRDPLYEGSSVRVVRKPNPKSEVWGVRVGLERRERMRKYEKEVDWAESFRGWLDNVLKKLGNKKAGTK